MRSRSPVAFIVGFGPGIGTAVAKKFRREGFTVGVASRSVRRTPDDAEADGYDYGIRLDMEKPEDVGHAFAEVEDQLGAPPSVVVYNVAAFAMAPGGRADPLSLPFKDFAHGTSVTGVNAFEVAKHANLGFDKIAKAALDAPRAFIATGNALPWVLAPQALGLSAGKRVLANIVEASASAYGASGKRFYFAAEVSTKGTAVNPPDPASHAEVFWRLYQRQEQGSWDVRFVKGGGTWKPSLSTD